jgi:stalled ribosome alternative rescue factor ArfA
LVEVSLKDTAITATATREMCQRSEKKKGSYHQKMKSPIQNMSEARKKKVKRLNAPHVAG